MPACWPGKIKLHQDSSTKSALVGFIIIFLFFLFFFQVQPYNRKYIGAIVFGPCH